MRGQIMDGRSACAACKVSFENGERARAFNGKIYHDSINCYQTTEAMAKGKPFLCPQCRGSKAVWLEIKVKTWGGYRIETIREECDLCDGEGFTEKEMIRRTNGHPEWKKK